MTATATIDWTKPVQASRWGINNKWRDVEIWRTDARGTCPVIGIVRDGRFDEVFSCDIGGLYSASWQFRNTPAPPVTFEFTRYVNVRRRDDGTFHDGGQVYADADSAARGLSNKFVTVPVTIRGEWKDGESNG